MNTRWTFPLCAVIALAANACTPEIDAVVVSQLTDPPLDAHASDSKIQLYEGTAVGIQIQAFTDRPSDPEFHCCGADCKRQCREFDNALDADGVNVGGEGVITVLPTEDVGIYIVSAESVGKGRVVISSEDADGEYDIPVTVLAQPDSGD